MNIMAKELNIDEGRCRKLAWFVVSEKNPRLSHPVFDTVSINTRLGALFVSYYGFVERKDFWNAAAAAGQIVYSLMEIEKFPEARNAAKIMFDNSGGNRLIAAAIGNSFFDYDDETCGDKGYYMLLGAAGSDEEFNEILSCCEQYYPVKPGIDWISYFRAAYLLFLGVIFLGPIVLGLVRIFLPQFAPPW
jgi:hypothetical protein